MKKMVAFQNRNIEFVLLYYSHTITVFQHFFNLCYRHCLACEMFCFPCSKARSNAKSSAIRISEDYTNVTFTNADGRISVKIRYKL